MTIEFDAISYAQQLESAGVPRNQADVHAKALSEVVSEVVSAKDLLQTKNELQRDLRHTEDRLTSRIDVAKTELSTKIETFKGEFNNKIETFKGEFNNKIETFKSEFNTKIDLLDARIEGIRTDLKADIKLLDGKIDKNKTELEAKIQDLISGQKSIEKDFHRMHWIFGLLFSLIVPIFLKTFWPGLLA